jgi:hypothetical protein
LITSSFRSIDANQKRKWRIIQKKPAYFMGIRYPHKKKDTHTSILIRTATMKKAFFQGKYPCVSSMVCLIIYRFKPRWLKKERSFQAIAILTFFYSIAELAVAIIPPRCYFFFFLMNFEVL